MTSSSPARLHLMLIDPNAAFSQGFVTCLHQYPDLKVGLKANSSPIALELLHDWLQPTASPTDGTEPRSLDVVLLSLDFGSDSTGKPMAIALCQEIHARYPALPILTLSESRDPGLLAQALQAGAVGFFEKGTVVSDVAIAIRQVAAGYSYWEQGMEAVVQALNQPPAIAPPRAIALKFPAQRTLANLRQTLRLSGIRQIDGAIADINQQLTEPTVSPLDHLVLTGQRRELRAARWLVNRLLPLTEAPQPPDRPRVEGGDRSVGPSSPSQAAAPSPQPPPPTTPIPPDALTVPTETTSLRSMQGALFDAIFVKLQAPLRNLTESTLEIDILREEKKRELLSIGLKQVEVLLDELRFSQISLSQLIDKSPTLLLDLWETTVVEFFGRYCTLTMGNSPAEQYDQPEIEVVNVLLQDAAIVQAEILSKIPLVPDMLAHLLFQTPLMVDDRACAVGTIEAMGRMELLLQNLIIQVANGVIQPLLNRFGDVVVIKQNFYDRRLLSSREIERFRNNLSWKYRMQRLIQEPTAIFESRYDLLIFQAGGITKTSVYSPRNQELDSLTGTPLIVTLALEARDAIAPRLRSAVSFVGSGVVYILTEVVGRGIGLIGRGIIKGIGSALQDTKFTRGSSSDR